MGAVSELSDVRRTNRLEIYKVNRQRAENEREAMSESRCQSGRLAGIGTIVPNRPVPCHQAPKAPACAGKRLAL
jgi:hypothetical protein